MAPDQAPSMSLVALVTAAADWRLAAAVILPRAVLATRSAPLSHMLMNGFFFNHGLDIRELLCNGRAAAGIGCLGVVSFVESTLERCAVDGTYRAAQWSRIRRAVGIGPDGCAA